MRRTRSSTRRSGRRKTNRSGTLARWAAGLIRLGAASLSIFSLGLADDSIDEEPLSLDRIAENRSDHRGDDPLVSAPSSLDSVTENLRFTIDLSSRISVRTGDDPSFANFVGLDLHKVVSTSTGDVGTLVFQTYLTRIDNVAKPPPHFDSGDDLEIIPRILNFNLTMLTPGWFNIRVGHFELPFGLEQLIGTNGTLRDYTHVPNLGVKVDWGVTFNGVIDALEYEFALSRGTGIEYFDSDDSFILSGRIGTPSASSWNLGLSGLYGEVVDPGGAARFRSDAGTLVGRRATTRVVRRSRVGVDAQYHFPFISLLGEVSLGEDYDQTVVNALVEADWTSPEETWLVYLQGSHYSQRFASGWDERITTLLGFRYSPDAHWAFSVQYTQEYASLSTRERDPLFAFQARYRF